MTATPPCSGFAAGPVKAAYAVAPRAMMSPPVAPMFTGAPTAEPESRRATRSTATIAAGPAAGWIEASAHHPPAGTLNDERRPAQWALPRPRR